ncbi:MAG: HIT family protein [Erysipelotrichales bacterium]|nr:HIT family protein [Erysipelotrichales bacterium]
MENNCIFCKIVNGDIPCAKIYEDDDVLAFLDISQTTVGHTLVISKKHYDNFLATPKDIMHKVMNIAQTIGQSQITNLHAKGVNILTNCYQAAGQTVMHFHVHVIPRYENNDGLVIDFKENKLLGEISLPSIANSIKKSL